MSLLQVQSPVDSATMSPVERTAAWVLNNGQYEEVEEDAEQNPDEVKHAEKVDFILCVATSSPVHPTAELSMAFRCCVTESNTGCISITSCCTCCHTDLEDPVL